MLVNPRNFLQKQIVLKIIFNLTIRDSLVPCPQLFQVKNPKCQLKALLELLQHLAATILGQGASRASLGRVQPLSLWNLESEPGNGLPRAQPVLTPLRLLPSSRGPDFKFFLPRVYPQRLRPPRDRPEVQALLLRIHALLKPFVRPCGTPCPAFRLRCHPRYCKAQITAVTFKLFCNNN